MLGTSDGEWDTTFMKQISDAISSIPFFHLGKIWTTEKSAWSVSARVSRRSLSRSSAIPESRVSCPLVGSRNARSHVFGTSVRIRVDRAVEQIHSKKSPQDFWWNSCSRKEFFDELFLIDPVAEIVSYDGPLLVVSGSKDDLPFLNRKSQISSMYHKGVDRLFQQDSGQHFRPFRKTG